MVEAIAILDHKSPDPEFLSFHAGDVLKIVEMDVKIEDMSWYRAHLNGKVGLVSDYMINIKPFRWFWVGTMTRLEAETKILESNDHAFLIRQIPNGQFYISYRGKIHDKKVWHFALDYNKETFTFSFFTDWNGAKKVFYSLTEMAQYISVYGRHMLIRWQPAPDEDDLIKARQERRSRWSTN